MIQIYGKDSCPYTMAAVAAYKEQGAEYINVKKDPAALARMLELSEGRRRVPVIVEDGKVTIGYGGT
jgi:glutaredoxin 3